jgi:hypothetical protein
MLLRAMPMAIAVLLLIVLFLAPGDATTIGVNYSTKGDNLLPSVTVASFLANHTRIDRVKLFDGNRTWSAHSPTCRPSTRARPSDQQPGAQPPCACYTQLSSRRVPQDPRVHASLDRGKKLCWTCDTNQVVDACPAGLEN